MIIFDDNAFDPNGIADLKSSIKDIPSWSTDASDPVVSRFLVEPETGLYNLSVAMLDQFANNNRLNIKEVKKIEAVKLSKKDNKDELDYELPVVEDDGSLMLVIFVETSDAHVYVFEEGSESSNDLENLTIYTLFSPVENRGCIINPSKYYAFSSPSNIDAQHALTIKFDGAIVDHQASTVYDLGE